ncbi:MAG: hypothetical protein CMH49_07465 [Myxococcales bacterium]|nr:hypothetical protein [Myxococcales bacterium]
MSLVNQNKTYTLITLITLITISFLFLSLGESKAQGAEWLEGSKIFNAIERIFGASNVNAITGHGGLTLGVSAEGDLSVMTWPSPSYNDQLSYISSNRDDARLIERFGASSGSGLTLGMVNEVDGALSVTWFRDQSQWTVEQSYGPNDGVNIHMRAESTDGLWRVSWIYAVEPNLEAEGVVIQCRVQWLGSLNRQPRTWLMTSVNLAPMPASHRIPALPLADWGLDGRNDFAAMYDEARGEVLHFHPEDQGAIRAPLELLRPIVLNFESWQALQDRLESGDFDSDSDSGSDSLNESLQEALNKVDETFNVGAYWRISTKPKPDQYQVGQDLTPLCQNIDQLLDNVLAFGEERPDFDLPLSPMLVNVLRCRNEQRPPLDEQGEPLAHVEISDAWRDAQDGELSGRALALGESNVALRTPLSFDDEGEAHVSVLLAPGINDAEARSSMDLLSEYSELTLEHAEQAAQDWLNPLALPQQGSERVKAVAKRSLLNLRTGTDRYSGAIVASITRQPSYGLDWPRDGAFFNIALDVAGDHELAEKRTALYAEWQRQSTATPSYLLDSDVPTDPETGAQVFPAGAWEMNYYADGLIGGFYRFEIDNTGFALWMMISHVGWAENPEVYLNQRWPAIERAADLLARWRDPSNGLQALAQEDDQAEVSQTLHGAITTFGSLHLAARAAELLGKTEALNRWGQRAHELREAILDELWSEEEQRFETDALASWNPGSAASGPTAWLVWPHTLLPLDDPKVQQQLNHDMAAIIPALTLEARGGAYFMKNTVSLALAWGRDPEQRTRLDNMLEQLAIQASNTAHFGETMQVVELNGQKRARQQVSTPHLWEGTLYYLTAMALESPERFFAYESILPPASFLDPIPHLNPPISTMNMTDSEVDEPTTMSTNMTSNRSGDGGCMSKKPKGIASDQDFGLLQLLYLCIFMVWYRLRRDKYLC